LSRRENFIERIDEKGSEREEKNGLSAESFEEKKTLCLSASLEGGRRKIQVENLSICQMFEGHFQ